MEQETLEPISASVSVLFEMDSLARIEKEHHALNELYKF